MLSTTSTQTDKPLGTDHTGDSSSGSRHGCPEHGRPTKRRTCRPCNAAYMRDYQRRRRKERPELELFRRAQERAARIGVEFKLSGPPPVPERCPVLGLVLTPGGHRRNTSPSLDRVDPRGGYVPGNVRVISDRANRLKGNRCLKELQALSVVGASAQRADFGLIARYVEREALLVEVTRKAAAESPRGEWTRVADFLDRALARFVPGHA